MSADDATEAPPVPDPVAFAQAMSGIAERSQHVVNAFLSRAAGGATHSPYSKLGGAFLEMTARLMTNPGRLAEAQMQYWASAMDLWRSSALRMLGQESDAVVAPERGDRRFRDEAWSENAMFDYIKQSYLLSARYITETVHQADGLDDQTARKLDFYTRQFVDAMAPTNFALTNPQVMRKTLESGGENLINGLENLISDIERGKGDVRISMTDEKAFEIGRDIAASPGAVVYENDLIQLIQYSPTTQEVRGRPLMIIPPWINKFYILDLKPKNSFIKWCVDQGLTVFILSWVNPDGGLASKSFEDYMLEGPLAARDVIREITGEDSVDAIGYCLGGTLLATTLSWLAARQENGFASATFFTTMVDFSEAGELGVFIDEEQLQDIEKQMTEQGYLDGAKMATTFSMLRANDLIWSFVVNNYLMGQAPLPFDLLYWNSDSTRMPAAMHSYYLRRMYQENQLAQPNALTIAGETIDLRRIALPAYILSTKEDHIAPWRSTYAATQLYAGPVTFTLAGSGHIAGVVNPPAAEKYGYAKNAATPAAPEDWLAGADEKPGSWWPDWRAWIDDTSPSGKVPAREPGRGAYPVIEPAPGRYVKARAV